MTTRIHQAHLFSMHADHDRAASISGLLGIRCPSAITRTVAKRVVDTFNGMSACWLHAHVGKEYTKVVPLITDCDSSSAVAGEFEPIGILASRQHATPTSIFRRRPSPWSVSVFGEGFPCALLIETAATLRQSSGKTGGGDRCFVSALTSTQPSNTTSRMFGRHGDDRQSSKALSSSVDIGTHNATVPFHFVDSKAVRDGRK